MKQILLILAVVSLVGCGGSTEKAASNTEEKKPEAVPVVTVTIDNPIVEKAIRGVLKKPTGELTKADLEKVTSLSFSRRQLTEITKGLEKLTKLTYLNLSQNQLTDVKGLERLTQLIFLQLYFTRLTDVKGLEKLMKLTFLNLGGNPDLTKAQIDELKKALPKCRIISDH